MDDWTGGELIAFDLETTGIDRFNDVPVSYALVVVEAGVVVRSWSGLIDPGREIPEDAYAVHGISTDQARSHGMPLETALSVLSDTIVAAGRRGTPVAGMKLDYDLTMVDLLARQWWGRGLLERGWCGPVLDVSVLDRHVDRERHGPRKLSCLCDHYGVELGHAHDASADAIAAAGVLLALAERYPEVSSRPLTRLHDDQIAWHRDWAKDCDEWRFSQSMDPLDPRDYEWPIAPAVLDTAA